MKDKKDFWQGVLVGGAAVFVFYKLKQLLTGMVLLIMFMCMIITGGVNHQGYDYDGEHYENGWFDDDGEFHSYDEEDPDAYNHNSGGAVTSTDGKIQEIMQYIKQNFLFDYNNKELADGMYKGFVSGLGDDYSEYYNQEDLKKQVDEMSGNFTGIGALVSFDKNTYSKTVSEVYEDSPAYKAGVKSGDVIAAVDGVDVTQFTLDETVDVIRGEEGTQVEVTFLREDQEISLTMTRAHVTAKEVVYEMKDDMIGYIKLRQFSGVATEQMQAALTDLNSKGARGIILDLRNNPGGQLTTVLNIADMFLKENLIICTEEDKNGEVQTFVSSGNQICSLPVVLLVNENSASASELLTGALKDQGVALVVGTTTFGKGIVQSLFNLSDGKSALKLTVSYYKTPSGVCLHEVGIEPDITVEDDETETDNQLERAMEEMKKLLNVAA